jgi:hypothetical protein
VLVNSTSGSNPYTSSGYIVSVPSSSQYFNDSQIKGDFTTAQIYTNQRDVGEYTRLLNQYNRVVADYECYVTGNCSDPTPPPSEPRPYQAAHGLFQTITTSSCEDHCIRFNACNPMVMGCAKSGSHKFPASSSYIFDQPTNWQIDFQYGSTWGALIRQQIKDPFWTPPNAPCYLYTNEYDESWYQTYPIAEDDGACKPDETTLDENGDTVITRKFYPHAPTVESRCTVPSGSSVLWPGIFIGCVSQSLADVPVFAGGNVCNYLQGAQVGDMPWLLYLNETTCVCSHGRWHEYYELNNVACDTVTEEDI